VLHKFFEGLLYMDNVVLAVTIAEKREMEIEPSLPVKLDVVDVLVNHKK